MAEAATLPGVRLLPAGLRTQLSVLTGRTFNLPLLVLYVMERCNQRCPSCDYWKLPGGGELSVGEIERLLLPSLRRLGTRIVLLSGGEPLMRRDLGEICALLRGGGLRLWLVTNGLLLARQSALVARSFDRVTVSLDGASAATHDRIRGIRCFEATLAGIRRLKEVRPGLPITTRCVLQRANFRELAAIAETALAAGADQVSFLPVDVSSDAFGRASAGVANADAFLLQQDEVGELRRSILQLVARRPEWFASGAIAESPAKLLRLAQYCAAQLGDGPYPAQACTAPWVSTVVEARGDVRLCYFHERLGNIRDQPLDAILYAREARLRTLDVGSDATCRRCVCPLRWHWRGSPW